MSKLVIVESPAKARTIGRILGPEYQVTASMGHVRDLPERELGVDLEHDFAPKYIDTPRSSSVLKGLRSAAKQADEIYLAPDPDREGEAIAWHLHEVLKGVTKVPFHRVTFHEITRSAIENAMKQRGSINQNLVDAQQARRVLDRIVGYQVSPLLWRKLEKGSSAGRVQSVALRLVVEREREIMGFVPEEYWNFVAKFSGLSGDVFQAELAKIDGKKFRIPDAAGAQALETSVRNGGTPRIASVERQQRRRTPPPPFTTSTLQQAANSFLHYTASSTMTCAQQLYEGIDLGKSGAVGLITYMRTDSVNIALEAQQAAAAFIRANYGEKFAPAQFNRYRSKAGAQEAHEAIRPTDVNRTPDSLAAVLTPVQLKLYTLIWKRFVASQMTPALYDQTGVDVEIKGADSRDFTFHAVASVLVFPGYAKVYREAETDENAAAAAQALGKLHEGENARLQELVKEQKFTEPPPRYTEATLVKALEENGIGRPSTYATILRTIQDRDYVKRQQNKLFPTELGFQVNDFLTGKLPKLFDVGFTADMEEELDHVEEGKLSWVNMMREFYGKFAPWLKEAKEGDAPPPELVKPVLALADGLEFAPARKVGRRSYDDAKFFRSIRDKFAKDGKISAKQMAGLIALAARYAEKISADRINALDPETKQAFEDAAAARKADAVQTEAAGDAPGMPPELSAVFEAFKDVEFEAPVTRGRITYDDRKFWNSLRTQAESGRKLSDKQLAALGRMVKKYRVPCSDPGALPAAMGMAAVPASAGGTAASGPAIPVEELSAWIAGLKQVKEWAAPSGKGRFTFDDKKFFQSLAKQFGEGKTLSPKQVAALKKLADKYGVK